MNTKCGAPFNEVESALFKIYHTCVSIHIKSFKTETNQAQGSRQKAHVMVQLTKLLEASLACHIETNVQKENKCKMWAFWV